ncbi:hypothetical protein [Microbispora hainanensis]|uniref:Amidase domain-containing protein n=1 Tax=Microbispora hainanensis TaxID=568844 RepID=A0ABZ1SK17_9ACTN|nr:hypothetical protein [Microbispora hainanensis]
MTELWEMAASDLAELVRGGEVSCREAIEAHLRRIEAVNPRVNAVAVPIAERGGFHRRCRSSVPDSERISASRRWPPSKPRSRR